MILRAQWEQGQPSLHVEAETDEEDKLLNALMSRPNHDPFVSEHPSSCYATRLGRASLVVYFGKREN